MPRILALISFICFSFAGFASSKTLVDNTIPIHVVTSFSILADVVKQIGGDKIQVTSLVGEDQDTHEYQLTPRDLVAIKNSKLLFINGLGLEAGWMGNIAKTYKDKLIIATNGFNPLDGVGEEKTDPHMWNNPLNVANYYVPNILFALVKTSAQNKLYFETNAKKYTKQLNSLSVQVREKFNQIPLANRQAITTHDAFGYFARAYDLKFLYAQGISTDSEATAKNISNLEKLIRSSKVKIVFLENMTNNKLIQQIAKDTGAKIGGKLYSDALSKSDGPATTYVKMINYNVDTLVKEWK
ncbi:MAG: zinc ABC transporter substrate-binding protein [Burkholderiales bacterium]|nr:zinc ABC transporter substrate-binding protein [Burkholderiales bacterium]